MKHRVNIETNEIQVLVEALEEKRQKILDEMLAPGLLQDELVGAVDALRQVDTSIKRWTKLLWQAKAQDKKEKKDGQGSKP